MQQKKEHSKNKKELLQFANVIKIKNHTICFKDKVVEITQRVEQKNWKWE